MNELMLIVIYQDPPVNYKGDNGASFILLQTGDKLLYQVADKILMEVQP